MKTIRNEKQNTYARVAVSKEVQCFRKADNIFIKAVTAFEKADNINEDALKVFREAVDTFCNAITKMYYSDSSFFDNYE